MQKQVKLTLEDRKNLYLEMMREVDSFCRSNGIRYSLSSGTLLGAIRHHGFIPWDDDFDIMMPLPDMIKFKQSFRSKNLKYIDIDTDFKHLYPFSEIESLKTYRKPFPFLKTHGLYIDLYPVLGLPNEKVEIEKYIRNGYSLNRKRENAAIKTKGLRHFFPIVQTIYISKIVRSYRDFMFQYPYGGAKFFFHLGGYPKWRAVLSEDFFDALIDVEFEGEKFLAISKYDILLKQFFGDYMSLPPLENRKPVHKDNYFWK